MDPASPHAKIGAGNTQGDFQHGGQESSSWHWGDYHDPTSIDGKTQRMRRYLRSVRSLYELQFSPKRSSAVAKMKPNPFGFQAGSTVDSLAALSSPIRGHQVLDSWSALDIRIYEDSFEQNGKNFYAIAQQLQNKSVKDTIAFYYIWKKHGYRAAQSGDADGYDSDDQFAEPEAELSIESMRLNEKLRRRHRILKEFFAAARDLYSNPKSFSQLTLKHVSVEAFGLRRMARLGPSIPSVSPLRATSILDDWVPLEIRTFELAIECYGKQFHRVASAIGSKSTQQVIAFYYVWKKDPYYQVVKTRWTKRAPSNNKKRKTEPMPSPAPVRGRAPLATTLG